MTTYVSADGHWRVSTRTMDGRALVRVEYDSPRVPGHGVPVHPNGSHRCGPMRTSAHPWYLVADVASVDEVARYVPLGSLEPSS